MFLIVWQFIRIVQMCLSSINNWRKSRWTHGVVIGIVIAVVIVVVVAVVVVVEVAVPALVEVVGGNSGGSSNFVLGTFPVLSRFTTCGRT